MTKEIQKIQKVRLLYENNEVVSIPVKYIQVLHLADFNKLTGLVEENRLYWMTTVNTFILKLESSVNNSGIRFSYDDMLSEEELSVPLTKRLENRLDLVAIRLYGEEENEEEIVYLNWDEENEYHNDYQVNELLDDGSIVIKLNNE